MSKTRHAPSLEGFTKKEVQTILDLAFDMKKTPANYNTALKGQTLVMWFEKASLRTRLSFEAGMTQLGGHAIYLDALTTHKKKAGLKDEVKCMARYADIMMARVYKHETIQEMIKHSCIPVINGLCNLHHPCQALADVMTIIEHAGKNAVIAWVGDGNNVCNSLIDACKMLGIRIQAATPEELMPISKPDLWTEDPKEAVKGADVVYTDVWVSMGEEGQKGAKIKKLQKYQVNKELLGGRYFMHCLPAIRGLEATDEVIDSKKSIIYDQAENKMHAQKALMVWLQHENNK